MSELVLTRRDLLKATAGAAVAALTPEVLAQERPKRAKVVLVRHKDVLDTQGKIHENVLMEMLDAAVTELVGVKNPIEAWKRLVKPSDLVGVKSNVWNPLPTPKEVEQAIRKRLMDAGVREDNIRIDDRGARSTLAPCTALINVRPVRTHWWSGIGGCIKNYIMFTENPASYHPDACSSLAKVWELPAVKGKTRLNILLALTPLFHGRGPHHWDPRYVWQYKGLFVSYDPVAVDAYAVGITPWYGQNFKGRQVKHLWNAHQRGLGKIDPETMRILKEKA